MPPPATAVACPSAAPAQLMKPVCVTASVTGVGSVRVILMLLRQPCPSSTVIG